MEQWIKTIGYFFMKDNNEDVHTIVVGPPGTGNYIRNYINQVFLIAPMQNNRFKQS